MTYSAKVLCDSVSRDGCRLTTMEVTFPRIILAEFNTHRMLSRNSASSRAIPVEKRIASVELLPFVPEAFGKNQKGMQALENLDQIEACQAREAWMMAKEDAVSKARLLARLGVHKQLANRLLEPFLWHTVIVSATEWENFFALRTHPDAQPEIRQIAVMMREAYEDSIPLDHEVGWHLPLVNDFDDLVESWHLGALPGELWDVLRLVSVGRCARVSYLTHDGKRDPIADIELAKRLQSSGHMSPFEHVARPLTDDDVVHYDLRDRNSFVGNYRGWLQLRKQLPNEDNFGRTLSIRA